MKKSIATIGLFSLMMLLTSFTSTNSNSVKEITILKIDNITADIDGATRARKTDYAAADIDGATRARKTDYTATDIDGATRARKTD